MLFRSIAGEMAAWTLAFERAKKLLHLLNTVLDAFGRADFSSAAQGARLFSEIFAVLGRP